VSCLSSFRWTYSKTIEIHESICKKKTTNVTAHHDSSYNTVLLILVLTSLFSLHSSTWHNSIPTLRCWFTIYFVSITFYFNVLTNKKHFGIKKMDNDLYFVQNVISYPFQLKRRFAYFAVFIFTLVQPLCYYWARSFPYWSMDQMITNLA